MLVVESTCSTNLLLQQMAEERPALPSGYIVRALFQTAGRGQKGNAWESEYGKNLIFSVLLRPFNLPAKRQFSISEATSLALKQTLDTYISDVSVKWPNDVYYKDGKIAGVLIENYLKGNDISYSIIGIGLNVNQICFSSDAPNPVSLKQITGQDYAPEQILEQFSIHFNARCELLAQGSYAQIHANYLLELYRKQGFYRYKDSTASFEAEIAGVEPDGHLLLKRRDGSLCRYAFKEVAFDY